MMMKTLNDLKIKEIGEIKKLHVQDGILKSRLMGMGFLKGSRVEVVKVAPFGDPIQVSIKGSQITLRQQEAKWIELKG